jgi:hypothetical protein
MVLDHRFRMLLVSISLALCGSLALVANCLRYHDFLALRTCAIHIILLLFWSEID